MARQIEAAAWAKRPLATGAGSDGKGGSSSRGGSSSVGSASFRGGATGDDSLGTQYGVEQVSMFLNVHFLF